MAQGLQRHVQGTQSSSFCLDNIECQGKPVRNNAGEVSTQGLGSHVKEFELFPPTSSLQLSDSAQRVKLGCVTRIDLCKNLTLCSSTLSFNRATIRKLLSSAEGSGTQLF